MVEMDMDMSLSSIIDKYGDRRVQSWLLMESPWIFPGISLVYLVLVLSLVPRFMESREPYNLKRVIVLMNFAQVFVNMWIVKEMYVAGWGTHYKVLCQPVDFSNSPDAIRMARAVWVYALAKVLDLLDTIVFVLRKKQNQVTFLHLYHHVTTLCFTWFVLRFAAGGSGTLILILNSSVHVLMYTYYLLAALGPRVQKYLWWKKYLTRLQMVQFIVAFFLNLNALRIGCPYNKPLMILFIPMIALNFIMFFNFYRKTYKQKNKAVEQMAGMHHN